jgi:hypothetical protein
MWSNSLDVNHVPTTAQELLWTTTTTMAPSSSPRDWKQPRAAGCQWYSSSSSSISPQTTTITLRNACFLPQQQQQQQQRWYNPASQQQRRAAVRYPWPLLMPAEPVGSRQNGWSQTEVGASFDDVKQPSCLDPCVIRSMDKVLALDDCHVTDDARLCNNPFDEESIDSRNENDDDVLSIGSLNGDNDALDLSLLGALDMNW